MLTLEYVEGPERGKQVTVDRELIVGRDVGVDVVIDDPQVSRRHARLRPEGGELVIEDLGSSNGTFVDGDQIHAVARVRVGGQVQFGLTVAQLHSEPITEVRSAVLTVPPGLAVTARRPDAVPAEVARPLEAELQRLRDATVKGQATAAPFAILALVSIAILLYLGAR